MAVLDTGCGESDSALVTAGTHRTHACMSCEARLLRGRTCADAAVAGVALSRTSGCRLWGAAEAVGVSRDFKDWVRRCPCPLVKGFSEPPLGEITTVTSCMSHACSYARVGGNWVGCPCK